ncbi:hypothetical protein [uncultured Winogradskyella sp.]|uniref:hypothetical protein n=1 Tax=uncultured Winogradskyella sp. TaxID=395353 RepID=UPI002637F2C5|nr:hypothetical protein [uncultured Winogradskyella sp.]
MKYLLTTIGFVFILSCQQKGKLSLEPLKIDSIDSIPFLMTRMQIDSVFETVTYGQFGSAKEGEICNQYILDKRNTVIQKTKSFMCCSYIHRYDSLGFLIYRSTFSDFLAEYNRTYKREGGRIIELEKSLHNDEKRSVYYLNQTKIAFKTSRNNLDPTYDEKVAYNYNKSDKITKKTTEIINLKELSNRKEKRVKTYSWVGSNLDQTNEKDYFENGIDYYETVTKFDLDGFPVSKIMYKNHDVICKTIIIKY